MEIRSFFKNIFGTNRSKDTNKYKNMELISGRNTISSWNGNLFDNDIVRSAIRPKYLATMKLQPKHIIRIDNEEIRNGKNIRIKELLKRPNRYMGMSDFLMKMTILKEINNNAFAYVRRDSRGYIEEIYPIPYSTLQIMEYLGETYIKFTFNNGKDMTIHYDDLIHLRKDFYDNDILGSSNMNAIGELMEVINTTDKGLIKAIRDSNIVRWLITYSQALREEDIKAKTKDFVDSYLSIDSELSGAVATDSKADLKQVDPKNYVPNALQNKSYVERVYSYFGVNENIVQNKYSEDEFNAFYESEIEPFIVQLSESFTDICFTDREKSLGNEIVFEATNLAYASMKTKIGLVQFVDRGILTPNEIRKILNLSPIEGGEKPIRRLDTEVVNTDINMEGGDDENEDGKE